MRFVYIVNTHTKIQVRLGRQFPRFCQYPVKLFIVPVHVQKSARKQTKNDPDCFGIIVPVLKCLLHLSPVYSTAAGIEGTQLAF